MKIRARFGRAALLTALMALGLAGRAEAKPIKIGVLTDISGLQSDNTGRGSVVAAEMAAEEAGLVLGQKVEVISADHQNKPDIGASIANRWLDQIGRASCRERV